MAKTTADGARGNSAEEATLLGALLQATKKVQHDRLWADFVQRYERLIVELRRQGAASLRRDLLARRSR